MMEKAARKNIIVTSLVLLFFGAVFTAEFFRFYKPANIFLSETAISLVILLALLFLLYAKAERIAENPLFSWVLVSGYILVCVMLLFPNRYIYNYFLYLIIAVVVAAFSGFHFGAVLIIGSFCIITISNGPGIRPFLMAVSALAFSFNAADDRKWQGTAIQTAIVTGACAVTLALTGRYTNDRDFILRGSVTLAGFLIVSVIAFYIRSQKDILWNVFNYSIFEEEETESAVAEIVDTQDVDKVYTITELCDTENALFRDLQSRFPKTADRDMRASFLARHVAGFAGADIELVQCACMYKGIGRLFDGNREEGINSLNIPENLKKSIIRENTEGFRPASFEEIIVYTVSETVKAYFYFKKQKAGFTVEQLVDSVCKLLLQKGVVRDCLLSMSLFHRMKQGIIENFGEYFS